MEKSYKVLFFDWHKTLSLANFWGQLADPTHDRHGWHQAITTFLFERNQPTIDRWMRGQIDENHILQLLNVNFDYPIIELQADLAESCRTMTLASDEFVPKIAQLRARGIKCVIATDNMDVFKRYTVPVLELDKHFDDILVSCDQGALKFDVGADGSLSFFDSYFAKHNLSYIDALLLDDRVDSSGTFERLNFDMFQVTSTESLLKEIVRLNR